MSRTLDLTDHQVAARFGVSRSTIWRWQREGDFPKAVRLGPGLTRWRLSDLEVWESTRARHYAVALPAGFGPPLGGVP
jgi:prophage regulatory protein